MPERVVIVEDDRELREFLAEILEDAGYDVQPFATADAALRALSDGDAEEPADVVVTDLVMPGMRGQELLRELRVRRPELNVIVITAFGSIDSAIELVKAGAYDYLTKPLGADELVLAVQRALADSRLRREVARLSRAGTAAPPGIVAASRPMQEIFQLLSRAAQSRHPVLITGESGTGKELIAREIHRASGRGDFVAINCAALPENLLESELFGHERGAFTGADREKPGLFEAAHGGTLFLDEVAELPLPLQPKLLRALEQGEVRRVGSTKARAVDARIVAATNRDLEAETQDGRFRDDLFWRLNVLHIHVPPLRERPADIPLLAEHFLARAAVEGGAPHAPRGISAEAMGLLTAYPWPGNVRELRNAIERAATLARTDEIRAEDLPPRIREAGWSASLVADATGRGLSLRELERAYIAEVLRQTGGNKSRAAEILGLDRKTLYRKLAESRGEEAGG
ncbi:MAG: sigma-54-dependent Fis family transcriptional regulator [Gemmatimonadetes bacterium]|nr:sigma-54-dependent Fis family transcriptional regulator [Gemmatimonadota bacterium]